MKEKSCLLAVVSYITWIGWIVALLMRDQNDTLVRRHLNQALILNLVSVASGILIRLGGIFRIAGGVIGVACTVFAIWGIVRALQKSEEPLPLIGDYTLIQ